MRRGFILPLLFISVISLFISCGGSSSNSDSVSSPVNNLPAINSFVVNPTSGTAPLAVTFSWNISDPDGDTLTCYLDINNDGINDMEDS